MGTHYWLMKSDPEEYSIEDLQNSPDQTDYWDGVRNYQARNFLRDAMQIGDQVLFYHSRRNPSVVGTAKIVKAGYPDHTAWDPGSQHFDSKSTPDTPRWFMVDIQLVSVFNRPVLLKELRSRPELKDMQLLRKGNRLSIMPVLPDEFKIIVEMGRTKP
jgi:predicted RNA-binding protein with PUA-like domain